MKLLLENGADHRRDKDGETPLTLAEKKYIEKGEESYKLVLELLRTHSVPTPS